MRPRDPKELAVIKAVYPRHGMKYSREEDRTIEQFAGTKTAEEIGMMIGRTADGVHHRIHNLGLSGLLHGEHHWNARVDSLRIGMIKALADAGYAPSEIIRMFAEPLDLCRSYVERIVSGKYRSNG